MDNCAVTRLPFLCSFCSRAFTDSHARNCHEQTHHIDSRDVSRPAPLHKCCFCPQFFPNASAKSHHEQVLHLYHPQPPFACEFCDELFFSLADLRRHEKSHMLDAPLRDHRQVRTALNCVTHSEWINIQFASSSSSRSQCVAAVELPCSFCPLRFPDAAAVSRHEKQVHLRPVVFNCAFCPRSFDRLCLKNAHESIHIRADPYLSCPVCRMQFASAAELMTHEAIHANAHHAAAATATGFLVPKVEVEDTEFPDRPVLEVQTSSATISRVFTARSAASEARLVVKDEPDAELPATVNNSPRKSFQCPKCPRTFARPCHLANHSKSHRASVKTEPPVDALLSSISQQIGVKQSRARRTFVTAVSKFRRRRHEQSVHTEPPRRATRSSTGRCSQQAEESPANLRHVEEAGTLGKETDDLTCSKCPRSFRSAAHRRMHLEYTHGGGQDEAQVVCGVCGKRFGEMANLRRHRRFCGGQEKEASFIPQEKEEEEREFATRNAMLCHRVNPSQQETVTCPICSKTFASRSGMLRHKFYHLHPAGSSCRLCRRRFDSRAEMMRHRKNAHKRRGRRKAEEEEGRFKCNFCPRVFARKCNRSCHEICHTSERSIACSFCPRLFTLHRYKWIHEAKRHPGQSMQETDKARTDAISRKKQRTQQKKKRRRRRKKAEIVAEELPSSVQTPVVETPPTPTVNATGFKCSFCPRRFARPCHRANHEISHTRERRVKCPHCDKEFARERFLHIHYKSIHPERWAAREKRRKPQVRSEQCFACALCPRRFLTLEAKSRHEESHLVEADGVGAAAETE